MLFLFALVSAVSAASMLKNGTTVQNEACVGINVKNTRNHIENLSTVFVDTLFSAYGVNVPAGKTSVINFCYDGRYPIAFAYSNLDTANGFNAANLNSTGGGACKSPSTNNTSDYAWIPDADPSTVKTPKIRCTQRVYPTGTKCYQQDTTVFVWVSTQWAATFDNGTAIPASWFNVNNRALNNTIFGYMNGYPCGTTPGTVGDDGEIKSGPTKTTAATSATGVPVTTTKTGGAQGLVVSGMILALLLLV